jgi:aldehyde:ferredoxin oxidoreductase
MVDNDFLARVLYIDLSRCPFSVKQRPELFEAGLGGTGVGIRLLKEERWRQMLTSLVICLCARGMYAPYVGLQALATAGFEWSADDLARFGAEVLHRKYTFTQREGFDLSARRIHGCILETLTPLGKIDEEFMRQSIQAYGRAV